jgi:formamidopyrimidine-DNA glycosylase
LYNNNMPELPEVETIRNDLKRVILGKKITNIEVRNKKVVRSSLKEFFKVLRGNAFQDISRVGKLMIFHLKNGRYLLIHLKMTGQLIFSPHPSPLLRKERRGGVVAGGHEIGGEEKLPNAYTRVIFEFVDSPSDSADKSKLYFNDLRLFGYLKLVGEEELKRVKGEYGIEPLTKGFTFEKFKELFKGKKVSAKALLMDQKLIAGIGNLYADEILFKAEVRPTRIVNTLKKDEIKKIFKAVQDILKKAIKYRGTTFSDYVDSKGRRGNFTKFLNVYRREGKKCKKCGSIIKKIKIGGRGTRYCDKCQL